MCTSTSTDQFTSTGPLLLCYFSIFWFCLYTSSSFCSAEADLNRFNLLYQDLTVVSELVLLGLEMAEVGVTMVKLTSSNYSIWKA